ncbi:indoleamine 2,3-dioxygenase 2 isoform X2 [Rana temporaria]|uniref:indoleamine 2,3-dioxygenase 2 isoform X2 n=1 Tax=Rana temporaria TaxID=8407 RepID=UPI001AAC7FAD|nr:indoleamine 2,3-dioxygenase 2 isoform X2 [Rana temporaria]
MEKQNLADCYVSEEHGFILQDPLDKLPDYYKPWMDIAEHLTVLIETKKLRDAVHQMPELDIQQLKGHRQKRLARTVLSHMVMAYVWQNGENGGVKVLPRVLAVPYHQISLALGLPLIMIHADLVLANWKKKDPLGPLTIENLSTIVSLPGGDSLQGFVLVTLLVEVAAIPAARAVIQAVKSVESDDKQTLLLALQNLKRSMNKMNEALHLIYDYVDSDVFYSTIRLFLSGWKDNPNMSEGLIYEGVSDKPLHLSGGSAAQSTTYHAFDELLGIQHRPESSDFLLKMRHYMPPAHMGFIKWVQEAPKLPDYVLKCEDPALLSIFNQCISALTELRSFHIRIVSKYVTTAGIRARMKKNQGVNQDQQERGTGGSHVMTFLKSVRDTCQEGTLRQSIPGDH